MLKTIDLFAGAGGLSLGFKQTGHYKLLAAAEIKEDARETYKKNIPEDLNAFIFIENVIGYDFSDLNKKLDGIDVVIGGPPCQGFSNANRQRNGLVSMNNALVKEYFRAIKEIRPRAFVMENVSMLKSSTHRFYDSTFDHDIIKAINDKAPNPEKLPIPMREDKIHISDTGFEGVSLEEIAANSEKREKMILPEKLYHRLEVLYKNRDNPRRLPKYLENHRLSIMKAIQAYCEEKKADQECSVNIQWLKAIHSVLDSEESVSNCVELKNAVALQKALITIKEITDNGLIGKFTIENNSLVYTVNSYAVINYINAILGDEYEQKGTTLNALWYGVPQDRKRHVIIGIRKDCLQDKELRMPEEPDAYQCISVKEAIGDLKEYDTGDSSDTKDVPYHENDKLSDYQKLMREGSKSVKNHFSTKTSETALERFKAIEQGKNFLSLPKEMKGTYSKPERTQKTIYLRLNPDEPSGTVVNVRKSMWIHPDLPRAVSVREAARLQSFPDWFEFTGKKDSQYQQVGNAVPPLLAKGIAEYLYTIIKP